MEKAKIFTNADEVDLFDDDNENPHWIYYLTHVLQVVYLVGFVCTTVLFVNAYVVHTHFFPGAPNNDLYSDRGTSLWWFVLCFNTLRFLFFLCMQWMFTFRNTLCCKSRYAGCTIFWMVLMVLILAADFVALMANSYFLATCNGLDAFGNPCNAAGWCCLPDVRVRPGNHCPNEFSASCPVVPEISKNYTFLGIFAVNVIFVVLELYFVILPLVLWFVNFRTIPKRAAAAAVVAVRRLEEAPAPTAPEMDKNALAELDPTLEPNDDDTSTATTPLLKDPSTLGVQARIRATDTVILRRPGLIPQTPLLAAAKSSVAGAGGLISHVTPTTEKNTKQP